jgi:hypothetical protein
VGDMGEQNISIKSSCGGRKRKYMEKRGRGD